ncbi:MAG: hypothetical protein H0S85_02265 [Desulfovibrionaceae bacterium]|nr:hypothetical protein [Desulfovibrionaceae bacterium]
MMNREGNMGIKYNLVNMFYDVVGRVVKVREIGFMGTENPRVGSSILSLGTTNFKGLAIFSRAPFVMTKITRDKGLALGDNPLLAAT